MSDIQDFDPIPHLNPGFTLPTFIPSDENERLWVSPHIPPLIAATVTIPRTPRPPGARTSSDLKRHRTWEYWNAVIRANLNTIPANIDLEKLLLNLCLSAATISRYPQTHNWYRQHERGEHEDEDPRKLFKHIAGWAETRAHCLDANGLNNPTRPALPTKLHIWTTFVLGNRVGGEQGPIVHNAISQNFRACIQRAKLQFLMPELGIRHLSPTDGQFWNGYPGGPVPVQLRGGNMGHETNVDTENELSQNQTSYNWTLEQQN